LRFSLLSLKSLTGIQEKILTNASQAVKPGGTLVYSTCSLEPEENILLIQKFCQNNPHFTLQEQKQTLPLSPFLDGGTFFLLHKLST
jgi:16S rRNA (cytosine967-C5)-methyltransferase